MQRYQSVAASALLSVVASISAHAESDLTGKWVGPFNGVQVEVPVRPSPFGYLKGEATTHSPGPRFVEATLQIDIEIQKKGLAVGTWAAGEFKQRFACAQINQVLWNCVDSGGRASLEVTSASEIRVCYLDNREGVQGAGCALLRRA